MTPTPEGWFKRMHEVAENPERAEELAREPRSKRLRKQGGEKKAAPPARDYLREWEQKQEDNEERRVFRDAKDIDKR